MGLRRSSLLPWRSMSFAPSHLRSTIAGGAAWPSGSIIPRIGLYGRQRISEDTVSAARTPAPFRGTAIRIAWRRFSSHGIPAAGYPGRVATNSDLIVAVDQAADDSPASDGRLRPHHNCARLVVDRSLRTSYRLDSEIVKHHWATGRQRHTGIARLRRHLAGGSRIGRDRRGIHRRSSPQRLGRVEVEAIRTFLGPGRINLPSGSIQQGPIPFSAASAGRKSGSRQ